MQDTGYAFDIGRILLGHRPWTFLLEIGLRTAVMYAFVLLIVRLLGKRGMGQLAPFDFVIVIALGSAAGDPMFYPDVPLLHALVAIAAIVLFTRGLVHLTQRSQRLKDFVSATTTRLVRDGVMDLAAMKREGIGRSELFQALRANGLEHLGQAERAYLEPTGRISIFRQPAEVARPGIPCCRKRRRTCCASMAAARRSWSAAPTGVGPAASPKASQPGRCSRTVRIAARIDGPGRSPEFTTP